jgi:hypothetical protein
MIFGVAGITPTMPVFSGATILPGSEIWALELLNE